MKQSIDLSTIGKSISAFFGRYHTIVFFLIISSALVACITIIMTIIGLSTSTDSAATEQLYRSFDEQTMERLGELRDAGSGGTLKLPDGVRTNPFSEIE